MSNFLDTTTRTVAWLKNTLDAGQLTIKPPYQRNPVWVTPQKAALIDTILRGYPIPEIYLQEIVDSSGKEHHYVVDGQQRIRACLEFVEGDFALDPEISPEHGELEFDDLPENDRQQIYSYKFVVRVMPNVPEEEIRFIFKRLNQNVVALNKQELRHSTYWGEFIQSMENLATDEFWAESGIFSANDFRRMLDVEYVSELAIGYLHGFQNKKNSLDRWYAAYEEEFPERSDVERVIATVTGELAQVLPDMRRTRWRNKSDSYTLFLVFANHQEDLPLTRDARTEAHDRLVKFGEDVSAYLTQARAGRRPRVAKRVAEYAGAVRAAATDLANRRARAAQVESLLAGIWQR
jgi:Protein of unknown function DUF262